jgi:hypothetical protein
MAKLQPTKKAAAKAKPKPQRPVAKPAKKAGHK